jgi:hypothetical protein
LLTSASISDDFEEFANAVLRFDQSAQHIHE